jgi:RimJ/RimL family protein N-acetyltransferase
MTGAPAVDVSLRPHGADDLWLQRRFMGDPRMTEHLGGPETEEQIVRRHERYLAMTEPADGQMFVVEIGPDHTPAGGVGYWPREAEGETEWETGWFVLPEFQGRGIASAATRLAIEAAWATARRPVHAYPNVENGASNAICRKVGMRLLGAESFEYPKGHWMTCNDWVIDPPQA